MAFRLLYWIGGFGVFCYMSSVVFEISSQKTEQALADKNLIGLANEKATKNQQFMKVLQQASGGKPIYLQTKEDVEKSKKLVN